MSEENPDNLATQIITPKERDENEPVLIPAITVTTGAHIGRTHRFKHDSETSLTVGRTSESQFIVEDPTLSRVHAKFTWMQIGTEFHMLLEDLKSTNGSLVNNERVDATYVKDGDQIMLGDVSFRFQCLGPAELEEQDRLLMKATAAETDPLTGLSNRRFLKDRVPAIVQQADSAGQPVTMQIIDIDHFKGVNDTYGHQVGDDVLKEVGRIIQENLVDEAVGLRYGGEEFVVVTPGMNLDQSRQQAEAIRESIEAWDASVVHEGLKITASIGVSDRSEGEPVADVLQRADKALYRAKESGRNQVQTLPRPT